MCNFCFLKHNPSECTAFNVTKENISRNGMGALLSRDKKAPFEEGTIELLNKLYGDRAKFKELIGALASYYGMGEYVKVKNQQGEIEERFEGEDITLPVPGSKEDLRIKINKEPIKLENGMYVWRYNAVGENGEIDPRVRINSLNTLEKLRENNERKIAESYKEAA